MITKVFKHTLTMAQESVKEDAMCVQKLFGGAFEISLPARFIDLSSFRLVPDHLEVLSDAHADQSVIIELVERVSEEKDSSAAQYHFKDIAAVHSSSATSIVSAGEFKASEFAIAKQFHCSWAFGTQRVSKGRDGADKANVIALFLVLIRLKRFETDLLISFNAPIQIHAHSQAKNAKSAVKPPQQSLQSFKRIIATFKIKDLSIFDVQQ